MRATTLSATNTKAPSQSTRRGGVDAMIRERFSYLKAVNPRAARAWIQLADALPRSVKR